MKRHLICTPFVMALLAVGPNWCLADEATDGSYIEPAPVEESVSELADEPAILNTDEPAISEAEEPAMSEADESADVLRADEVRVAETPATDRGAETNPNAEEEVDESGKTELIRERYPNGAVRIEREVKQDAGGNYINHGTWRMWDQRGVAMCAGQCVEGERQGTWNRWYQVGEVEMLKLLPYNQFNGPFLSTTNFEAGKVNGKWTIYDSKQHKISEFEFVDGERHGLWAWWFANGHEMREAEYIHGELDGQFLEWAPDSRLMTKETFQHGRKLAARSTGQKGQMKTDGFYMLAKEVVATPDDWWTAKLATYVKQGKDEKHGAFVTYYPNGQKQSEREYRNDVQIGKFNWWYSTGQKAVEGAYVDGEQEGRWVWWHANGQKSIQGKYANGHPIGHWTWWNEGGKVTSASDVSNGSGEVVQSPMPMHSATAPQKLPTSPQLRVKR